MKAAECCTLRVRAESKRARPISCKCGGARWLPPRGGRRALRPILQAGGRSSAQSHSKSIRTLVPPFTFRCPDTGFRVQGWTSDDDESEGDGVAYEVVTCPACGRLHLVYPENSPDDRRK